MARTKLLRMLNPTTEHARFVFDGAPCRTATAYELARDRAKLHEAARKSDWRNRVRIAGPDEFDSFPAPAK